MTKHTISKSQYVKGLQCPKALWLYRHRKDLAPEITPDKQALFDTGHEIGELAMQYFGDGVEVTNKYWDVKGAMESTRQYIKDGHDLIFEATAIHPIDGSYARIDILKRVPGSDEWDLIEVKSSTSVKDYHIDDMSFQYHVFYGAGYKIRKCFMMLIDNQYGYVLERKAEASVSIGARCFAPFECDYKDHCWAHVPDYSVYDVFPKSKAEDISRQHGVDIEKLPEHIRPTGIKAVDVQSYLEGETLVNAQAISSFLKQIEYPIYYLDYETIMPAIPMFDDTRPFQQIPFQFSVHVQHEPGGELTHHEFLHKDRSDPRRNFAEKLVELCGDKGTVLVYNQSFEIARNKELAQDFPEYADAIQAINARVVDLLEPFKQRWLYHPNQHSTYCEQDTYAMVLLLDVLMKEKENEL